jgi:hypothetical protein
MSTGSRPGGSRASDEDSKTAVKVGMCDRYTHPGPNLQKSPGWTSHETDTVMC